YEQQLLSFAGEKNYQALIIDSAINRIRHRQQRIWLSISQDLLHELPGFGSRDLRLSVRVSTVLFESPNVVISRDSGPFLFKRLQGLGWRSAIVRGVHDVLRVLVIIARKFFSRGQRRWRQQLGGEGPLQRFGKQRLLSTLVVLDRRIVCEFLSNQP